jgi:hypothetical protein
MVVVESLGEPVTLVDALGEPVTLLNADGTLWVSQGFDQLIASLLSAGETVAFYDPNDLTSIYAARTGGANATVNGVVGLMLDKAQMGGLTAAEFIAALDTPELVTNGTFDTDTTGWTAINSAILAWDDGKISVTRLISYTDTARQEISCTIGKYYKVTVDVVSIDVAQERVHFSSLASMPTLGNVSDGLGVGTRTAIILANASTMYLHLGVRGNDQACVFDNISVKELPGYHATAPSDAARPILRDVSSTYALDFDNVDDAFAWTTPAITDGTWVALTRSGSYAASAAYSAGTYTMPIYQPFDLCAILWTSADLTTVQEAIVLAEGSARGAAADFGAVTGFGSGWRLRSDLRDFPVIDTSSGTVFSYAWNSCSGLTSFPLLNISSATDIDRAWFNCTNLTSFPLLDTSSVTNFMSAWNNCTNLTSFPLLDTSSGTNFQGAWYDCVNLTSFPSLDVSSGTNFVDAWRSCSSLTDFPANMFDSVTATNFGNAFLSTNLTQTSIDNILTSINTADTSGGTFNQSGGSAPSATGEAAIDALRARGWTVTVTGGY